MMPRNDTLRALVQAHDLLDAVYHDAPPLGDDIAGRLARMLSELSDVISDVHADLTMIARHNPAPMDD